MKKFLTLTMCLMLSVNVAFANDIANTKRLIKTVVGIGLVFSGVQTMVTSVYGGGVLCGFLGGLIGVVKVKSANYDEAQ